MSVHEMFIVVKDDHGPFNPSCLNLVEFGSEFL